MLLGRGYPQLNKNTVVNEVTGAEGRSTSFEITMNDQLIFSKLETKGFPYSEDIIDAAQKASRGETVSKITKKQNCVVM
ncbi:migration and invasion enhancer 1-like [Huso huso]|uniref:Migration and invasion enhancer 1-like n=1 Tax=Huso huso TaxID=61971 RepID=A0ABR0YX58_HUSHU